MEWIRRNPRRAAALGGLVVLVVLVLAWGAAGSGSSKQPATLGGPTLATPTATPSRRLTAFPSPSAVPTSQSGPLDALAATGGPGGSGAFGPGAVTSLARHHVVISAGSDAPLMAVGWWMPLADGRQKGSDTSHAERFRHADTTYGDGEYARVLAFGSSRSRKTWCTVAVDGKVVDHQEGRGPWARVFCRR